MSKDTEIDMKDVELSELDQEKLPMAGDGPGTEKNGSVKLKVPDEDVKFTGLLKEELIKVSGTPGCKPQPEMNWWNQGPLYQISDLGAFNHDKGIKGVVEVLDSLNQLKVKGLVLGPLHTVLQDQADTLDLVSMDPRVGTDQDLLALLDKAHKKGISVVLNLTPNPGADPWFSPDRLPEVLDNLRSAAKHWLGMGVDGVQVSGLAAASSSPDWYKVQGVFQGNRTEQVVKKRALIGVSSDKSGRWTPLLSLNSSGVDLLLSDVLTTPGDSGVQRAHVHPGSDLSTQKQSSLAWGLGGTRGNHLASAGGETRAGAALPGTGNPSCKREGAQKTHRLTCRSWFKTLSDLRGEERSLLHGDYFPLHTSSSSLITTLSMVLNDP
ncbi:unnamed protein product, partial [Coregonus sp. 'balchen']